jgi:hypothetical protein
VVKTDRDEDRDKDEDEEKGRRRQSQREGVVKRDWSERGGSVV